MRPPSFEVACATGGESVRNLVGGESVEEMSRILFLTFALTISLFGDVVQGQVEGSTVPTREHAAWMVTASGSNPNSFTHLPKPISAETRLKYTIVIIYANPVTQVQNTCVFG